MDVVGQTQVGDPAASPEPVAAVVVPASSDSGENLSFLDGKRVESFERERGCALVRAGSSSLAACLKLTPPARVAPSGWTKEEMDEIVMHVKNVNDIAKAKDEARASLVAIRVEYGRLRPSIPRVAELREQAATPFPSHPSCLDPLYADRAANGDRFVSTLSVANGELFRLLNGSSVRLLPVESWAEVTLPLVLECLSSGELAGCSPDVLWRAVSGGGGLCDVDARGHACR
jgi:hypothetical protein